MPPVPAPFSEADYETIAAAVLETARGRWFLAEHARRNRNADTRLVLDAIEKLERMIAERGEGPQPEQVRVDLVEMMDAITRTKTEIASIRPAPDAANHFDQASSELDAIVGTTEKATSDILASAERVQEMAWTLREQGANPNVCDLLDANASEIYSACSFQDLTGQRIGKVVEVLRFLEARIDAMIRIWRLDDLEFVAPDDARLVSAPARHAAASGEALEQHAVDKIMGHDRKPDVYWRDRESGASSDACNLGAYDLDDLEVIEAAPDAPSAARPAKHPGGNGHLQETVSPPTAPNADSGAAKPTDDTPRLDALTLAARMALFA